jgi:hypothetical protein
VFVILLACTVSGQRTSFPDYDYSDFSNFRAVASPAALPPRAQPRQQINPQQRQREQPIRQQIQPNTRNELPPRRDDGRRQQVGRGEAVPQDIEQREEPRQVAILKQINE